MTFVDQNDLAGYPLLFSLIGCRFVCDISTCLVGCCKEVLFFFMMSSSSETIKPVYTIKDVCEVVNQVRSILIVVIPV